MLNVPRLKNAVPVAKDNQPIGVTPSSFLRQLKQLHKASHYALAVSGGADSMALVVLASQAARLKNAPKFTVLSVDHGLRSAAKDEVKQVAAWCRQLGVPHQALKVTDKLKSTGVQEAARQQRYQLMAAWCRQHKAEALVVAHHQQDQAETVLMRLAHQSGINGLAGMVARQKLRLEGEQVTLLRPFLSQPPESLRAILQKAGQSWLEDPSNADMKFERVRTRQALPSLADIGLSVAALADFADKMQILRTSLDRQAVDWLGGHACWTPLGYIDMDAAAFLALEGLMRQRILAALLRHMGGQVYAPKRRRLDALVTRLQDSPSGASTLGGCLVRWRGGRLMLGREEAALSPQARLKSGHTGPQLWDGRFFINLSPQKAAAGVFVAPLGKTGLAALKADGLLINKQVPSSYLHVLPAFFLKKQLLACPVLVPSPDYQAVLAEEKLDFNTIFDGSADW